MDKRFQITTIKTYKTCHWYISTRKIKNKYG